MAPLPNSPSAISLNDVQNEFGGSNPIGINEYYGVAGGVPSSGTISLANFYGTVNARGIWGGGFAPAGVNTIDYVSINSTGNATDFGDLYITSFSGAAFSSSTRGVFFGGNYPVAPGNLARTTMQYVTISSAGNSQFFGNITSPYTPENPQGMSNETRGILYSGDSMNAIHYVTIASAGNSTLFGYPTPFDWRSLGAGFASPTRGIVAGGQALPGENSSNSINYITIASTGNATDFGDLTRQSQGVKGCSSSTRGVIMGGNEGAAYGNVMDYITIASTGNATDFGDLTLGNGWSRGAATSSSTRGLYGGGQRYNAPGTFTLVTDIHYITIASTGNSTFFGNLTQARGNPSACSNAHGGL